MSKINDGGPAFPGENEVHFFEGMSLRDWFAGQAMAGVLANEGWSRDIATIAYATADAMLAAREPRS